MVKTRHAAALAALVGLGLPKPALADLVVSQLIVELSPLIRTADVVVINDSDDRSYIAIEPSEVIAPGTPAERRVMKPDPRDMGLLVSSTRLILEPHQKRLLRLAVTSIPQERERVYRVVVKPVVGGVDSSASALKLLVGYEMLVLIRPVPSAPITVAAERKGGQFILTNKGRASVELLNGKYCSELKHVCSSLPSKRLYAGASWSQSVPADGHVRYLASSSGKTQRLVF